MAHGGTAGIGVVVGTGEVVKTVGDIERELGIGPVVRRAFAQCALGVNDEVPGGGGFFAGDGLVVEADDVGRSIFAKELAVGLRDALVIREDNRDFTPDGAGIGLGEKIGQCVSEPLNRF